MDFGDVFRRVLWQAEERRAAHERDLANERQLQWQRALVLRLLRRRFGELPAEVVGAVESAGGVDLDGYADRLVVAKEVREVVEVVEVVEG